MSVIVTEVGIIPRREYMTEHNSVETLIFQNPGQAQAILKQLRLMFEQIVIQVSNNYVVAIRADVNGQRQEFWCKIDKLYKS